MIHRRMLPEIRQLELVAEGFEIHNAYLHPYRLPQTSGFIGHLFCLMHNGNMPDWKTRYSTKLFAERVMPHLKDLWPEWKHDERWWMHPMDDRIRPEERRPGAEKEREDWPR